MATHSSLLAWRILWTEEPGGLQSVGSAWRVTWHAHIKLFIRQLVFAEHIWSSQQSLERDATVGLETGLEMARQGFRWCGSTWGRAGSWLWACPGVIRWGDGGWRAGLCAPGDWRCRDGPLRPWSCAGQGGNLGRWWLFHLKSTKIK